MVHIIGERARVPGVNTGPTEYEKGAAASLYNMLVTQARRIRPNVPLSKSQAQGISHIINALRGQRDALKAYIYDEAIAIAESARKSTDIVAALQEKKRGY